MEPFIGQIMPVGFNFAPRGWALCEGQLLAINNYTAVFSLLGTTFGGDGRTTFGLPDLRGRSIVGVGSGPGLDTINWGEKSGNPTTTLTTQNLPAHSHGFFAGGDGALTDQATGNILASESRGGGDVPNIYSNENATNQLKQCIGNTGSNVPFSNRAPFLGIYVAIALVGVFPSRS